MSVVPVVPVVPVVTYSYLPWQPWYIERCLRIWLEDNQLQILKLHAGGTWICVENFRDDLYR